MEAFPMMSCSTFPETLKSCCRAAVSVLCDASRRSWERQPPTYKDFQRQDRVMSTQLEGEKGK